MFRNDIDRGSNQTQTEYDAIKAAAAAHHIPITLIE